MGGRESPRDRNNQTLTPFDQGKSPGDRDITTRIRKEVVASSDLSTSAHYVKIITTDDFVFDIRCLPNPHYDPKLRDLTGLDTEVQTFLEGQANAQDMLNDIRSYIEKWLPSFVSDNRSYLTVAIGCTGGQHRSVYFVEQLAKYFGSNQKVLTRHRELK